MVSSISSIQRLSDLPANPLSCEQSMKKVSFDGNVRVKRHIHINAFTDEERMSCWYSKAEEKQLRDLANLTADLMAKGQSVEETRGLESRTREGSRRRHEEKVAVWDAVLHQQDIQFENGARDDEMISIVYRAISYKSQIAASMMGTMDERNAEEIHRPSLAVSRKTNAILGSRVTTNRRLSCRAA